VKTASIDSFLADPAGYWSVSRERGAIALAAKPNAAHRALTELEAAGRLAGVITQNTDGLHQAAGTRHVIELHGSGRTVECMTCGRTEPRADVQARLDVEMPPRCTRCGGRVLKPTVVLFGEPMPALAMEQAFDLASASDVMLVVGSSLVVHPAAEVPLVAARAGASLVVVNAESTPVDRLAQVVIRGRAGEVLPEIVRAIDG
jgi:NAD-dependent deacetylase